MKYWFSSSALKKTGISTILNIIGLSVAFAAFMVIMVQVMFDWKYDRNYQGYEKIFRFEYSDPTQPGMFESFFCRPSIEMMKSVSPKIAAAGTYRLYKGNLINIHKTEDTDAEYIVKATEGDRGMLDVFPFEFIEGDTSGFDAPNTAVISESTANMIWPGESAVGKSINGGITIVAVYKDFPLNSSVENGVLFNLGNVNMDTWSEWSYMLYLRLYDENDKEEVETLLAEKFWGNFGMEDAVEAVADSTHEEYAKYISMARIEGLHDLYFDKLSDSSTGKGNKSLMITLFTVSLLIVIIAVINFVNFAMAFVPFRIKSINTKKVLGSSRSALIFGQLGEALVISLLSFGLGVILMHLIAGTDFATFLSVPIAVGSNLPIVAIGFAAAVFTALAAAIFPALYSTSFQPAMVLKGSFSLSAKGRGLRSVLVGFQYVISFVLAIVALYIAVHTKYMKQFDMGFEREQILEVPIYQLGDKFKTFEEKLMDNPNILDVTFAGNRLVSKGKMGWGRDYNGERVQFDCLPCAVDFIDFFGMEILEGRNFLPSDDFNPNGTFIMNEQTMAKYPFLKIGSLLSGHAAVPAEIVGVVKNFNFKPLQYGIEPIALYLFGSDPWWPLNVAYIKVSPVNVEETISFIRSAANEIEPNFDIDKITVRFLDESIGRLYEKEEHLNKMINAAAAVSILISVIGILGLVYFEMQFRRKEIALRKVHGAEIPEILGMINRYYILITAICFVIAALISVAVIRSWVSVYPYHAPIPVWIFAVAFAFILLITVITVSLYSLKSASRNPIESLSNE